MADIDEITRHVAAALSEYGHSSRVPKKADEPAEFAGVGEVAARLFGPDFKNKFKVRELIRTGKIEAVKSGGERSSWWIRNKSVDAFIAGLGNDKTE
jgi:hypothetical protein